MMSAEHYRSYTRFIRLPLLCTGLWPRSKEPGFFYRKLAIFGIFCGTVIVAALGNFCRLNITNIGLVTRASGLMGSFTSVILKASRFFLYRKDLAEVNKDLGSLFENALADPRLRPSLLSLLRFFPKPSQAIMVSTAFVVGVYIVGPPKVIARELFNGVVPEVYPASYPAVYFWSFQSSLFLYVLHYLFELLYACFVVCVTTGVDCCFGYYMFHMSALLRVLSFEFESLKASGNENDLLRKCVTVYTEVIRFAGVVQEVYGPIVLYMAVTNGLIMCSLVFQAVQPGGMSIEKAFLSLFYIFLKLAQAFMYAWCGQLVSEESENLQLAIYCSDWYKNESKAYRKGILLVIAQRPITITACHFFNVSLDFFVTMLSTAVSYFALLQTLDDSG